MGMTGRVGLFRQGNRKKSALLVLMIFPWENNEAPIHRFAVHEVWIRTFRNQSFFFFFREMRIMRGSGPVPFARGHDKMAGVLSADNRSCFS